MSKKPSLHDFDNSVIEKINELEENENLSTYKSGQDENGTYTIIEKKRPDGTVKYKSVFSDKNTDGKYLVRTVTKYGNDGIEVKKTTVFDIIYNADGSTKDEVKRP